MFGYANLNPLLFTDPLGLAADGHHGVIGPIRRDPNLSSLALLVKSSKDRCRGTGTTSERKREWVEALHNGRLESIVLSLPQARK